jgi:DNA polymerase-4
LLAEERDLAAVFVAVFDADVLRAGVRRLGFSSASTRFSSAATRVSSSLIADTIRSTRSFICSAPWSAFCLISLLASLPIAPSLIDVSCEIIDRFTMSPSFAARSANTIRDGSARPHKYARSVILGHLDLDAFFAAVEELEDPELRGRPLVVGGDPRGRGVVATANYAARGYGISSAMSCAEALRRCPHALFLRPRMTLYRRYSQEVWSIVRGVVPTVEQTGIDEGYLDLGELAPAFDDARALAEAVQAVVRARTQLSCSLGIASSKVVAKVASDCRKPGGLTVVRPGREAAFLAPFPIRVLPGIGPRAEARLVGAGVETIGDLAALPDEEMQALLPGKVGRVVRDRARGVDPRPLEASTERISISHEETFPQDVGDPERLHDELNRMAERLGEHLRQRGQTARTVTTKLRYPDFSIRTRSASLPVGTDEGGRIGELACSLLDRALRDRPGPLRLVGVGVSGLAAHAQLELSLSDVG